MMLGRLLYEALCCVGIPCKHYKHCHANTTLQTLPNKHTCSHAQCSHTRMPTCPPAHMLTCPHKVGPYHTQLCNTVMPITQPIMPPPRNASHTKPPPALPHMHTCTQAHKLTCPHAHMLTCTHAHAQHAHPCNYHAHTIMHGSRTSISTSMHTTATAAATTPATAKSADACLSKRQQ